MPGNRQVPVIANESIFHHSRRLYLLPLRRGQPEPIVMSGFVSEPHVNHAVRSRIGIRIHQNRIHDAEHRGGRPDPQCQRDHSGQGETGTLDQLSQAETDVLKRRLHRHSHSDWDETSRDGCTSPTSPGGFQLIQFHSEAYSQERLVCPVSLRSVHNRTTPCSATETPTRCCDPGSFEQARLFFVVARKKLRAKRNEPLASAMAH